ncbi:MAG TPA: tyrosine-type recombinase/integrase [Terriglobia bacterium]|nr:tyrosine-type recombinase/integrase [Terriglobia bacterium]
MNRILEPINQGAGFTCRPQNFRSYVQNVFLPQRRKKWKDSTDRTTTERLEAYLLPAFGDRQLLEITREELQRFLDQRAEALSKSVIDHMRWDLKTIFKMAVDDGIIRNNPAGSLVTPRTAKRLERPVMSKEQVQAALQVLDLRERLVFLFAVLVGIRPGEIFALRWKNVGPQMVSVMERVYRGLPDTPKTERGLRDAAVPPDMAADLQTWREISLDTSPEALVFPSERGTYMSRDNFLRRNIRGKLAGIGLGWVTFQVLRRTQASLGHQEGIDPKIGADQRGHAIGVSLDTYTKTDLATRLEAVSKLEQAFLQKSEVPLAGQASGDGIALLR